MIDKNKQLINDIERRILNKFGFGKLNYFPENRGTIGYRSEFLKFCNEIEIETFKDYLIDNSNLVLFSSGVSHQGVSRSNDIEKFSFSLSFGFPRQKSIDKLKEDCVKHGRLVGTKPISITLDFPGYEIYTSDLLGDAKIEYRNNLIDSLLQW